METELLKIISKIAEYSNEKTDENAVMIFLSVQNFVKKHFSDRFCDLCDLVKKKKSVL